MQKSTIIPSWLKGYKKEFLSGDLSAGITVGIMLIPQGMAYASLAGLPPVYGLYAAMIPQLIYAFLGTSRQVSVGPVAIDSMLIAATVGSIASVGPDNYLSAILLLTLIIGVFQVVFGWIGFGFLVNFLSKPVISGFTSAAAFVIGLDQLKNIFGIDIERGKSTFGVIKEIIYQFDAFNYSALVVGLIGIFLIRLTKKWSKKIPGSLVAVLAGLGVMFFIPLDIQVFGAIPQGMPTFQWPIFDIELIKHLLPSALAISLIAYMESISVSKALQMKHKGEYQIDNNREFIALGMADIVGSFFGAFHTTGGFSRSAVNDQAGANTNLANIISSGILFITLLFLTPIFESLPKAIIASIILVAVYGLVDTKYPKFLWKTKREDFYMLLITFVITFFLGIQEGILLGMILSLLLLVKRTAKPHIAVLAKLKGSSEYRNTKRFDDIEERKDILIIRQDAQLYFANCNYFCDKVKCEVENKQEVKLLVLHFGSVSNIDSTALSALEDLVYDLKQEGIRTYFSDMIGPVRDFLTRVGLMHRLGKDHFFLDVQSAIDFYDKKGNQIEIRRNFERAIQSNDFEERKI
ncbi:sulfate permease [Flammeovirga yaeyamensis]|uniref:Sulfate permease n=1 Tax=Flammeovirga yaeyamensis TaxID=367791 RepID=A0AAX1N3G3_9BACT|nr:sulfate permease [Flammeovirga yaeyamensis]MBB3700938.1 SulP family sulfate permease [Flammeovirga yaeyamensis]NMF38045.1 sulfate permease [Flammeovirga yaeyamensis]QWG00695.1 sulfate permease [Flammeovirga yaeyamensis]